MKVYAVIYQSRHGDDILWPNIAYKREEDADLEISNFMEGEREKDQFWYPFILKLEVI